MENLRSDLMKESAVAVGEDELYEEIEAPKFVDFTVPDRPPSDDRSWFCVRVGCDQNHEEVDPDALYRSFVLRVMAARSPNVGLQNALNRQAPRSVTKCPHSAPAKPAKDRTSKFSIITSAPEKKAKTKLKVHPISTLGSTSSQMKAKVQAFASEKALTTPRKKKYSTNRKPFRSVKYQKVPIGVPKSKNVAKALFLDTPMQTNETTTPMKCCNPISEVCAEMKKPNISSQTKNGHCRYLCKASTAATSERAEASAKSPKKKTEVRSQTRNLLMLREGIRNEYNDTATGGKLSNPSILNADVEEHLPSSVVSSVKESLQSATADSTSSNTLTTQQNSKDDLEEKVSMPQDSFGEGTQTPTVENATEMAYNKENESDSDKARYMDLNATNFENERLQSDTRKNVPQKAIMARIRSLKEPSDQEGKHKRTTNPKPFRFRTDERGILKEANLEKKRTGAQKEIATALRHGEGLQELPVQILVSVKLQQNEKPSHVKKTALNKGDVHNAQLNLAKAHHKLTIQLFISKDKEAEKSQNKTGKLVTSSVMASGKLPGSLLGRENSKITIDTVTAKGKRPTTVPKEPNFHRIHLPKGCMKRLEMVTN